MFAVSDSRVRVIRIIARLNVGGPAKHVVWLTTALHDSTYSSMLVTGTVPSGEEDMSYFAAEAGVEPLYISEMSREISPKDVITIWKLFRLFRRIQPHIVHTHTAKAGTVGRVAGLCYKWLTPAVLIGRPRTCKFVHTYHGHIFHSYYGPLKTRAFLAIERLLARLITDRLIVISEQQRREISSDFGVGREKQFSLIPIGLDLQAFDDWPSRRNCLRSELGVGDDVVLVGIVGRLTEIKNHQLFVQAVAEFKNLSGLSDNRVQFVIIGDGSLRSQLEQQVQLLGLEREVKFVGSRKDPENFYPALDIVALTSLNEGTPLTLIEAMANSRAIIATRVGGVVDLLGEGVPSDLPYVECARGIGVAAGDAVAFAKGLHKLVQEPELRRTLGERGRTFVEANYRKERLVSNIRELYAELLRVNPELVESCSSDRSLKGTISNSHPN